MGEAYRDQAVHQAAQNLEAGDLTDPKPPLEEGAVDHDDGVDDDPYRHRPQYAGQVRVQVGKDVRESDQEDGHGAADADAPGQDGAPGLARVAHQVVRQAHVADRRGHDDELQGEHEESVDVRQDQPGQESTGGEGEQQPHEHRAVGADRGMQQPLLGSRRDRVLMRSGFHGLLAVAWPCGRFALAASLRRARCRPEGRRTDRDVLLLLERDRTVAEAAPEPPQPPTGEPDPAAARRLREKLRTAQHQRSEPQQARQRR